MLALVVLIVPYIYSYCSDFRKSLLLSIPHIHLKTKFLASKNELKDKTAPKSMLEIAKSKPLLWNKSKDLLMPPVSHVRDHLQIPLVPRTTSELDPDAIKTKSPTIIAKDANTINQSEWKYGEDKSNPSSTCNDENSDDEDNDDAELDEEELMMQELVERSQIQRFESKSVILQEGQLNDGVFFVVTGKVRLMKNVRFPTYKGTGMLAKTFKQDQSSGSADNGGPAHPPPKSSAAISSCVTVLDHANSANLPKHASQEESVILRIGDLADFYCFPELLPPPVARRAGFIENDIESRIANSIIATYSANGKASTFNIASKFNRGLVESVFPSYFSAVAIGPVTCIKIPRAELVRLVSRECKDFRVICIYKA